MTIEILLTAFIDASDRRWSSLTISQSKIQRDGGRIDHRTMEDDRGDGTKKTVTTKQTLD
jgi:hypothetical protein